MMNSIVKRLVPMIMSGIIVISSTLPVHAGENDKSAENIAIVNESAIEKYEQTVVDQRTSNSEVAFEVMFNDMDNLNDYLCIFKPNKDIKVSETSKDTIADLIVSNADGSKVALIQCKDASSISQVRKTYEKAISEKVDGVELIGTQKCTDAFNRIAEQNNVQARMVNSRVSEQTVQKMADEALGTPLKSLVKKVSKESGIEDNVKMIKSVVNGDFDQDDVAKVAVGAIDKAPGKATKKVVYVGLTFTGLPHPVKKVIAFISGVVVDKIVIDLENYNNLDKEALENIIAKGYDDFMTGTGEALVAAGDAIDKTTKNVVNGVGTTVSNVGKGVGAAVNTAATVTGTVLADAGQFWGGVIDDGAKGVKGFFTK